MISIPGLFGTIETSNLNPLSAWDFQQGSAFQSQFGSGLGGFNNWLGQSLNTNPNLTLGDAYAQYNSGTGTPGFGNSWENLATLNPAAFNNAQSKFEANGLSPDTLVSDLQGGGSPGMEFTMPSDAGSSWEDQFNALMNSSGGGMGASGADQAAGSASAFNSATGGSPIGAGTAASTGSGSGGALGAIFDTVGSLFVRGALVIVGALIIVVAIAGMAMDNKTVRQTVKTVGKALA